MTAVPPSLKKIKVFLTRAEELDRDKSNPESRVVAYNVRQYAVLTGIPLAGSDSNAKACLGELLNVLEKEKDAMSVFSKEEHWKICRKVADRVFDVADKEDRMGGGGGAYKGIAKSFYAAGTFYEILQQFYPNKEEGDNNINEDDYGKTKEQIDEEEKRRLYCKWKATDILNAIKEGRTPTPGGFQKESESGDGDITSPDKGINFSIKQMEEESSSSSLRASLPPAPSMPSSNFFNDCESNTSNDVLLQPPPSYDGFELNLNGDVAPVVGDVNEGDEESGMDDICNIPSRTTPPTTTNTMFVNDMPPPSYASAGSNNTSLSILPPPVTTRPLPPPIPASQPTSSKNSMGVISSLFNKSSPSSSSSTKLSKEKMADAIELTMFALAALQKGDSELGRERLEQTLGLWRR
jgi:vacuolar protein sorting-associated protein VTA1